MLVSGSCCSVLQLLLCLQVLLSCCMKGVLLCLLLLLSLCLFVWEQGMGGCKT